MLKPRPGDLSFIDLSIDIFVSPQKIYICVTVEFINHVKTQALSFIDLSIDIFVSPQKNIFV